MRLRTVLATGWVAGIFHFIQGEALSRLIALVYCKSCARVFYLTLCALTVSVTFQYDSAVKCLLFLCSGEVPELWSFFHYYLPYSGRGNRRVNSYIRIAR